MTKKALNSIVLNGITYKRMDGNWLSSCAQCEIKGFCWDVYHYDTPCYGGFYKEQ